MSCFREDWVSYTFFPQIMFLKILPFSGVFLEVSYTFSLNATTFVVLKIKVVYDPLFHTWSSYK
jgi:hypothetical protein